MSTAEEIRLQNAERFQKKVQETRENQLNNPHTNPCYEESQITLRCLYDNVDHKSNCRDYAEKYKKCKVFWSHVRRDRKKKKITPHLPNLEDRDEVREEYKSWL